MAKEKEINEAIIEAFNGDVDKFKAYLKRAALETELAEIESAQRKKQKEQNKSADEYNAELTELATKKSAKIAEIDALG